MTKHYSTVIFDFDGTLADTYSDHIYPLFETIVKDFKLPKLTPEQIEGLRDMTIQQALKQLKLPIWKLPKMLQHAKDYQNKRIDELELVPGIKPVVEKLKESGYHLGVLTSNDKENVEAVLQRYNLSCFDFIYSSSGLFGKAETFRKMFKEHKIDKKNVIYLGDEVRDVEACKKVGVPVIAVTWGFNTRRFLEKYKPDFVVDRPEEINQCI